MTLLALALVLVAAGLHAWWNLLAKRSAGGAPFVWLFSCFTALFYAPLALLWWRLSGDRLGWLQLAFVTGSAALHLGYFLSLQRGYRRGDLSLVYPLARGSGPLLATIVAVALLGERPTALALAGTLLIVGGSFFLLGNGRQLRARRGAVAYGLLTGAFIATYTVWDAVSVTRLEIAPLVFIGLSEALRAVLLAPLALRRWPEVRTEWRRHRREVLGVAILSPLAYLLVLLALTFTPISYVAPAREVSILIGAVLGARLLAEEQGLRRTVAAAAVVLGVVALALG